MPFLAEGEIEPQGSSIRGTCGMGQKRQQLVLGSLACCHILWAEERPQGRPGSLP